MLAFLVSSLTSPIVEPTKTGLRRVQQIEKISPNAKRPVPQLLHALIGRGQLRATTG